MRLLSKSFWIRFIIYDAIFFLAFYGTIIFTFPLNELLDSNKELIESKIKYKLEYQDASLSLALNIKFKNLQLTPIDVLEKDKEKGVESLRVKSLELSPHLMKIYKTKKGAFSFDAEVFNGEISGEFEVKDAPNQTNNQPRGRKKGAVVQKKDVQESNYVKLFLEKVSLTEISSFFKMKLPIHGDISGSAETYTGTSRGKLRVFFVESNLNIKDAKLGEGKVKTMYGDISVPQIKIGDLSLVSKMDKNVLKLEPIDIKTDDVEANLDGNIGFGMVINPNLKIKYKFTDSFLAANKPLSAALSGLNLVKSKDGYYQYQISGTLDKLKYTQIR
ncbi:type II secretion system protein GspN [bacterium]|nr:type II secretion system protein GspN [bacterium]